MEEDFWVKEETFGAKGGLIDLVGRIKLALLGKEEVGNDKKKRPPKFGGLPFLRSL